MHNLQYQDFAEEKMVELEVLANQTISGLRRLADALGYEFEETIEDIEKLLQLELEDAEKRRADYIAEWGDEPSQPSAYQEAVADYQRTEMDAIRGGL